MSFCIVIPLVESFSTDTLNAESKLLKKELFEAFWWYYSSGSLGLHSISPVSFEFPIGTGNVGYCDQD